MGSHKYTLEELQDSISRQIQQGMLSNLSKSDEIKHAVCGLTEEAGEVSGLLKREAYKQEKVPMERWVEELGDVLWYVVATANALGVSLDDVFYANETKLKERYGEF